MAFFCAACLRVFHQSFSSAGNCSVLYVACIMYIVCVDDSTLSVHQTWTDVCLFVIMDIKLACFPSLYLRATHYGKQILSPSVDWQRKTTMMLFCKLSEVYTGGCGVSVRQQICLFVKWNCYTVLARDRFFKRHIGMLLGWHFAWEYAIHIEDVSSDPCKYITYYNFI